MHPPTERGRKTSSSFTRTENRDEVDGVIESNRIFTAKKVAAKGVAISDRFPQ